MSLSKKILFFLIAFLLSQRICADELVEHTKIWSALQLSVAMTEDKKWNYYVEPQLRLVDDKYKFNEALLRMGIYYQVLPELSLWLGVQRGYALRLYGKSEQVSVLWERLNWDIVNNQRIIFNSRSILEERKNLVYSQIANRLRERLSMKFPLKYQGYFLVLTDEAFIQLNRPHWVTDRVFSQNRASIGLQVPVNQCVNYEVGYLNQLQYNTPRQMSSVVYVNVAVFI